MQLRNLGQLTRSMLALHMTQQSFEYRHECGIFDVLYCISPPPYRLGLPEGELLLGARGAQCPFAIMLHVTCGEMIDTSLASKDYRSLCKYLERRYDPEDKFSPSLFFKELDRCIPRGTHECNARLGPRSVGRDRNCDTDGSYFVRWLPYHRSKRVMSSNLEKTRNLLGDTVFAVCREQNIGSCWATDESRARRSLLPAL